MNVTPAERNQIAAALKFWAAVAASSQTHPARHPDVAPLFEDSPRLTISEVERLAEAVSEAGEHYLTPGCLADIHGVTTRTIHRILKREKVLPVFPGHYRKDAALAAMERSGYARPTDW